MISFFLQAPLRYPILHKGSRSAIKDNINDKLTEKEREPIEMNGSRYDPQKNPERTQKENTFVCMSPKTERREGKSRESCQKPQQCSDRCRIQQQQWLGEGLTRTAEAKWFPLYPKGGEKLQFDYGVYLLNKNIAQLRYQHSLGTTDLRQTLPNLKTFLEHGLLVRCDRHHTSSAIPVPKRPASSAFGSHEFGFSSRTPTPEKGPRKRASSENEKTQYRTPPPSYKMAVAEPIAILVPATPADKGHLSSSLDASIDASKGNTRKDFCESLNGDSIAITESHGLSQTEPFLDSCAVNGIFLPNESMEFVSEGAPCGVHPSLSNDLHCAVEQAEEILGTEASDFTSRDQFEAFNSIPVDRAVAVECDDQVLGEFEEFSRRIYALNENMSSFRRPRKSSDK